MRSDPAMLGASEFERLDNDAYFTLEAGMCVEALLSAQLIPPTDRVYEIAAGRGHLMAELTAQGYSVFGSDLVAHKDPLADIVTPINILEIKSLKNWDAVITNLPYLIQDRLLEHLLPIAARDNCKVAILTRAPWHLAQKRRALVHGNRNFIGIVHLPRRPYWSEQRSSSPRHDFVWNVWGGEPRASRNPVLYYSRI